MKTNLSRTVVKARPGGAIPKAIGVSLRTLLATGITFIFISNFPPLFAHPNSNFPQQSPTENNEFDPPCRELMAQNHPMMGQGLWGNSSGRKEKYSYSRDAPSRVETIQGTVLEIQGGNRGNRMPHGMYLLIKTNTETLGLHIGPAWYLDQQNFQIKPNDVVQVTGTRVNWGGQQTLIVGEIKKGNQTLQLRDEEGYPRWMGWQQQTPRSNR